MLSLLKLKSLKKKKKFNNTVFIFGYPLVFSDTGVQIIIIIILKNCIITKGIKRSHKKKKKMEE